MKPVADGKAVWSASPTLASNWGGNSDHN